MHFINCWPEVARVRCTRFGPEPLTYITKTTCLVFFVVSVSVVVPRGLPWPLGSLLSPPLEVGNWVPEPLGDIRLTCVMIAIGSSVMQSEE